MCRNIKTLFNFDPPATDDELRACALQYVRKISGMRQPSQANAEAFEQAVEAIYAVTRELVLEQLETRQPAKDRAVEAERARERGRKREQALRARLAAADER